MQPNHPYAPYAQPQQQQVPNPYANPYAPPAPAALYRQNVFVPHGAVAGPLVGPTLRKVKLALGIAQTLAMVGGFVLFIAGAAMQNDVGQVLAVVGMCMLGLWYMLLFGYAITNMIWLYQFWSWIPPDQRHTNMWKKYISPGTAVGFMFIPYFNIYWMFVVYLGLSDIMERMRVQFPSSKGPVKTLAILTLVIPMVFFPAGPFLQYMLAKHLEEMAREMHVRMGGHVPA
jgi:hypothetical protein